MNGMKRWEFFSFCSGTKHCVAGISPGLLWTEAIRSHPGRERGTMATDYNVGTRGAPSTELQSSPGLVLQSLSLVWLFATCLAPLSMGFPRQEYWSGLPCPSPGDLPNPGIEPASPAAFALADKFFTTDHLNMQKQSTHTKIICVCWLFLYIMMMAM